MKVTLPSYKKPNSVSLIQMPNGTGKTTIIELIESCLTGASLSREKVQSFRSQAAKTENGEFALHIYAAPFFGASARDVTIVLKFNFVEGEANYFTIRDVTTGQEAGWQPPSDLRAFLAPRCIEVFVFKGDKVESLLDKTRDDAEQAIKAFFGISKVYELIERINSSAIFDVQGPQTDKGVTARQNVLRKWLAQKALMEKERRRLEDALLQADRDHAAIRARAEEIERGEKDSQAQLLDIDTKIAATKVQINALSERVLRLYKNPFSLSANLTRHAINLKDNLDQLKLPGTSRTFFHELVEKSSVCICDRPMDAAARTAISSKAESYLGDEHISVVNGVKQAIQSYSAPLSDRLSAIQPVSDLKEQIGLLAQLNTAKTILVDHNKKSASDEDKLLMQKFEECVARRTTIKNQLDEIIQPVEEESVKSLSSRNADEIRSLDGIEKVIRHRTMELAELSATVTTFKKKELLQQCLKEACRVALEKISAVVCQKSNRQLKTIFPEGTFIEIKSIGKHIQLGYGNHDQEKGSGAQNVAVAYSFASTLLHESGMKFPLIVDHPMIAVEEGARKVLGKVLPAVCNQFVGFVIDTEKDGFFDSLRESEHPLDTITIFRNIAGNQRHLDHLSQKERALVGTSPTTACISTDPNFFATFSSDERIAP